MSFLTEYFDEYREHPIRKTKMCRPEDRWARVEGNWLNPKTDTEDRVWTDEEIAKFIKETMKSLRGQSTYFNNHCAHLSQEFKTRPFVPRPKKKPPCPDQKVDQDEPAQVELPQKLALKDTEVMRTAQQLYERDLDKPTLEPLPTHFRMLGYMRGRCLHTGLSEYQAGIARLAYSLTRAARLPPFRAHTGCRPVRGQPPDAHRQPLLDVIPFNGERLY